MKFKEKYRVIYCTNDYHKIFDQGGFYYSNYKWRFKGYVLHREDGPAIEYNNGDKEWFKNGVRHRIDGPAVDYSDGYKEYWLNEKEYGEEKYYKLMNLKNKVRVLDEV